MSKQTKPRYELHRQSDTYVTLGDGDHHLCSICIKKTRGVLDAQLILLVMNSHKASKNLLDVAKKAASIAGCDWLAGQLLLCDAIGEYEAAIQNTEKKE